MKVMTNDEYYTPSYIIEAVRIVLGSIDLDPSSTITANTIVQAGRFITREEDGLKTNWGCNCSVFLNPPSGETIINGRRISKPIAFWNKLLQYRLDDNLTHGIFLCYIYNMMVTSCNPMVSLSPFYNFPIAFLNKRLNFLTYTTLRDRLIFTENNQPISGNFLVYVSGSVDKTAKFVEQFSKLGGVMLPSHVFNKGGFK